MGRKTAAGRAKAQHTSAQSSATSASDAADTPSSRPVYFWRETEPETGYLSQWYPCAFTDEEGTVYKSAEQYVHQSINQSINQSNSQSPRSPAPTPISFLLPALLSLPNPGPDPKSSTTPI